MATIQDLELLERSMGRFADTLQRNRQMKAEENRQARRDDMERQLMDMRRQEQVDKRANDQERLGIEKARAQADLEHQGKMEGAAAGAEEYRKQLLENAQIKESAQQLNDTFKRLQEGVQNGTVSAEAANKHARGMVKLFKETPNQVLQMTPFGPLADDESLELFKEGPGSKFNTRAGHDLELAEKYRKRASDAAGIGDAVESKRLMDIAQRLERSAGRDEAMPMSTITTKPGMLPGEEEVSVSERVPTDEVQEILKRRKLEVGGKGAPPPAPAQAKEQLFIDKTTGYKYRKVGNKYERVP